ncbi:MAG: hypothetical protein KIT87_21365 [Anaerolineae bacterium]|nr:hypothetical protein [Anaerolineae bacterium]
MLDHWGEDYIRLGLRIEKLFPGFVDGYYGPPELKAEVDAEPAPEADALVRAATALADALPAQGFEERRAAYLGKQVRAIETVCRRLAGESFSLEDEAERYYDIRPTRIPEAQFEAGLALLEAALPGAGTLTDRMEAWRKRHELPRDKTGRLLGLLNDALAETRQRALDIVPLPEGEGVELATVTQQPWGAYNWYRGGYRSRVEFNTDLPTNLARLPDMMAHEAYPGHHTEHALREKLLYQDQGYLEHSILLINTPECVISEGIATVAADQIFAPGEAHAWLRAHVYPMVGLTLDDVDEARVEQAEAMLRGVRGNAVFLLHEDGRSDDEVVAYLMRYSLLNEQRALKALEFLKSPLWRAYTFTYFYGRDLILPLLQGGDRRAVFGRLLTEQVYPSLLAKWNNA